MSFQTRMRVRFGDEDHARIVYYPRFFHFFHCAFEDFFDQQGHPYRACLDSGIGWPAVHAEADYASPLRFGDELVIDVSLAQIGKSSATFRYVGRVAGASAVCVTANVVVACLDMSTYKSREIPDEYRHLFEKHLEP